MQTRNQIAQESSGRSVLMDLLAFGAVFAVVGAVSFLQLSGTAPSMLLRELLLQVLFGAAGGLIAAVVVVILFHLHLHMPTHHVKTMPVAQRCR